MKMKHLILDTETTALVSNSLLDQKYQPRIIEFYGCLVDDDGELIRELEFFVDPGMPIPAEVTKITGIKPEDLKGAQPWRAHAPEVKALIEEAHIVVAHNLSYDSFVIGSEMQRLGREVSWPFGVCTVESTEHLKGHRLKLSDLHELLFGEPFTGAHRARVDVAALKRCYFELINRGEI